MAAWTTALPAVHRINDRLIARKGLEKAARIIMGNMNPFGEPGFRLCVIAASNIMVIQDDKFGRK